METKIEVLKAMMKSTKNLGYDFNHFISLPYPIIKMFSVDQLLIIWNKLN